MKVELPSHQQSPCQIRFLSVSRSLVRTELQNAHGGYLQFAKTFCCIMQKWIVAICKSPPSQRSNKRISAIGMKIAPPGLVKAGDSDEGCYIYGAGAFYGTRQVA
jgi:hypothetical protein